MYMYMHVCIKKEREGLNAVPAKIPDSSCMPPAWPVHAQSQGADHL